MNVTILGAGVVGCAIAHELASRGARVRVVDPRGTGRGASRASAGMLAPHIEGHIPALHRLGVCSLSLYDRLIDRLRRETDQPVEYERTGTLQVARGDDEVAQLRAEAARLTGSGIANTWLSPVDLRRSEPRHALAGDVRAGLLIPDHGYVAVPGLVDALAAAAQKHGAEFSSERALAIEARDARVRVATMDRTIESDAVVIAAGSWTPEIAVREEWESNPEPRKETPAVKPIRGQLVRLRARAGVLPRVVWGSGCYLVPWHNGTVLVGATVEDVGYSESPTAGAVRDLLAAAASLVPELAGAEFDEVRVGLRPMTADELPIIGPSATMRGVYYATGHFRNGILLAPLTASMMGDLVMDGRAAPELELTRPSRFGL